MPPLACKFTDVQSSGTYKINKVGLIQCQQESSLPKSLLAAIEGFEAQKRRIDAQIADLRQMLDGGHSEAAAPPEAPKGRRRKLSAAARKRIGDAQRKRWAESKRPSEPPSQPAALSETPKRKRKRRLSAAGKAAIVAALKKRWAAKKAAAVKARPVVAKKSAAKSTAKKKAAPAKATTKKVVAKKAVKKAPVKVAVKRKAAKIPQKTAKPPEQAVAEVAAQ